MSSLSSSIISSRSVILRSLRSMYKMIHNWLHQADVKARCWPVPTISPCQNRLHRYVRCSFAVQDVRVRPCMSPCCTFVVLESGLNWLDKIDYIYVPFNRSILYAIISHMPARLRFDRRFIPTIWQKIYAEEGMYKCNFHMQFYMYK